MRVSDRHTLKIWITHEAMDDFSNYFSSPVPGGGRGVRGNTDSSGKHQVRHRHLGIVKAAQSGVYTISPSGTVTATNSGIWLGGDAHAGGMTIIGSTTQTIDIAVNNYVPQNGVTPSTAICNYNGGGATPCALHNQPAPGAGKPLLIGVTLVVDGTQQKSSVATPTFDVVVSYD